MSKKKSVFSRNQDAIVIAEANKTSMEKDEELTEPGNGPSDGRRQWETAERQPINARSRIDRAFVRSVSRIARLPQVGLALLRATRGKLRAFSRRLSSRRWGRLPNAITVFLRDARDATPVMGRDPYVPSAAVSTEVPKLIAFYLPQFHPIPENDEWWGQGFTEWTNVVRTRPLFEEHHQPRRPSALGYYDLRIPEAREAQAELARAHGIHGFCYYHYWFDRRRLLERPLDEVLETGTPDFPFCLCWANESWTRSWDGSESRILIEQRYADGFAERLAHDLVPYLFDPRYIRVGGRPLLIVYRVDRIPRLEHAVGAWRRVLRDRGVGEVFLAAVEGFGVSDPTRFGFDGAVEFPPHNPSPSERKGENTRSRAKLEGLHPDFHGALRDYRDCVQSRISLEPRGYPLFRGVMPSWDNTARNDLRALIYHHASPQAYQGWLTAVLRSAARHSAPHEPLVFINAWNEWAEGAYLEPDATHDYAYLQATKAAFDSVRPKAKGANEPRASAGAGASPIPAVVTAQTDEPPEISIVVPAFDGAALTRACLNSIYRHQARSPFDVTVVEHGSSDDMRNLAREMPWVHFVQHEQKDGFGSACNLGAERARGAYLAFLRSDTIVSDGCVDALRETFEHWPRAGLVGSKLVYGDGTIEECGNELFRDGSTSSWGRGGDARDPRYCYARETDYVSAALMIRRDLFGKLGGFDDSHDIAHHAELGLALRIRTSGTQVVVNPHAEALRLRGAETDVREGVKRGRTLEGIEVAEWSPEALSEFPDRPRNGPVLRKRGPRVLVVDYQFPRPDRDSGSVRMTGILAALRQLGCHVTLATRDLSYEAGYELPLERIGVEVLRRPFCTSLDRYLAIDGDRFDCVILSRRDTADLHIRSIDRHCSHVRLVFDTCDLHFLREGRKAQLGDDGANARKLKRMKNLELDLIKRSDVTLVVSPEEQTVLRRHLPQQDVRVLSNIIIPNPTPRPFSARSGLLFIGWFLHTPNIDAVLWFAREVMPELNRKGFHPVLHVVGSDPPKELMALDSKEVRIHGFVPDVEPLFNTCRLSVAPLRYGAGVKGKINQSMALGLPCVTTTVGAEGMFLRDGVNCLIGDEPTVFASNVHQAYHSEKLWSAIREHGLRSVQEHFSPEIAAATLRDIIQPFSSGSSVHPVDEIHA